MLLAQQGRGGGVEAAFEGRHEAVEVDVGVDGARRLFVVSGGVEFENLDRDLADVFHPHVERHRVGGLETGGIAGREIEIDSFFQRLVGRGRERGGELLGLARILHAAGEPRFGEDGLQPLGLEIRRVVGGTGGGGEEVEQVVAHEGLLIDGESRQQGFGDGGIEGGHVFPGAGVAFLPLGMHVRGMARDFHIL